MKWKLVPEEPTKEMVNDFFLCCCMEFDGMAHLKYKAMPAAAPVTDGNHKTKVIDILKGSIAMIEELEIENALLRDKVKALTERLK